MATIKRNPFISEAFLSIWLKHFGNEQNHMRIAPIDEAYFIRHNFLAVYSNIGKFLTCGQFYELDQNQLDDAGNEVIYIYDVPNYSSCSSINSGNIKRLRVKRYKGYLLNLARYDDYQEFVSKRLSAKFRYNIRNSTKRLNKCFEVKYKVFYGPNISKSHYDLLIVSFFELLQKRTEKKKLFNAYLNPINMQFISEVFFPLMIKEQAVIFVCYHNYTPIYISLNYLSKSTLFGAFTVFDNDYSKFSIGHINTIKQIKWCYEKKITLFDFSKDEYAYKEKLCNITYNFEDHILFRFKSLKSTILAYALAGRTKFKQILRDYQIHKFVLKLKYQLKSYSKGQKTIGYTLVENPTYEVMQKAIEIDLSKKTEEGIRKSIFDWLYKKQVPYSTITVFKDNTKDNVLYISEYKTTV